jgi:Exonuclease III
MGHQDHRLDALTLLHCNVNGLRNSITELKQITNEDDPDIITLNETKLSPQDTINIPNYTAIRLDKDRRSGGIAILHKTTLPVTKIYLQDLGQTEILTIKITLNKKTTHVTTIYSPPKSNIPIDLIKQLSKLDRLIILGDFNAHHHHFGDATNNKQGRQLLDVITTTRLQIVQLPGPTRIPSHSQQHFTSPDKVLCTNNVYNTIAKIDILPPQHRSHPY